MARRSLVVVPPKMPCGISLLALVDLLVPLSLAGGSESGSLLDLSNLIGCKPVGFAVKGRRRLVGGHEILNGDGQRTERWRPRELRGGGHQICLTD